MTFKLIENAENVGLRVQFVTSDYGSENLRMWKDAGVDFSRRNVLMNTSIPHPQDQNRRLEFVPDPVHIFKNVVNGWINNKYLTVPDWYVQKNNLVSNIVHRDHLKLIVECEAGNQLKMCHKLTANDVDFTRKVSSMDKMKVSNATKYCNPSVGAALHMIAEKEGKPELHTTACFVEDISKWFSIINNRNEDCALNSGDEDNTIANISHLNDTVRLVYDLTVGDSGAWKPWKTGLAMCTHAIIRLIDLLLQNGHTQILTSRFTQDCLESLFSLIRYSQKRPTPLQFTQNLRIITLSQFMSPVPNASYSFDDQSHLIGMADIISSRKKNKVAKPAVEQREGGPDSTNAAEKSLSAECMVVHGKLCEKEEDLVEFNYQGFLAETGSYHDRAEKNVIYFMAGYVLRKMSFRPTTCRTCLKGCKSTDPESIQESLFTRLRSRQTRNKNAFFVSRDVFDFFIALDVFVRNGYSAFGNESDIQNKIEREAEVLPNIFHCVEGIVCGRFDAINQASQLPSTQSTAVLDDDSIRGPRAAATELSTPPGLGQQIMNLPQPKKTDPLCNLVPPSAAAAASNTVLHLTPTAVEELRQALEILQINPSASLSAKLHIQSCLVRYSDLEKGSPSSQRFAVKILSRVVTFLTTTGLDVVISTPLRTIRSTPCRPLRSRARPRQCGSRRQSNQPSSCNRMPETTRASRQAAKSITEGSEQLLGHGHDERQQLTATTVKRRDITAGGHDKNARSSPSSSRAKSIKVSVKFQAQGRAESSSSKLYA
ncbi:conserved hypothetical protein [Culex quinquefasciatus]|uniref:Transposable element P transposase-like GTP-binding insertion domain-containing protein n=1 Tax=Culex quinquefasciatus TaxID=7176 RepID=B0WG38_CULQU|nr:conserved hypothetical protein [Culex quinquefasciatus]|eukprot:XP_001847672.1 conserved hypothetical protein [Culex quinquefasciatus]